MTAPALDRLPRARPGRTTGTVREVVVPVHNEERDVSTALADLRGSGLARQLVRFLAVGAVSTAAYVLLYALLRTVVGAQSANLAALALTAVANTTANRRLTFGVSSSGGMARHQAQGLVVFAIGWGLTGGALAGLHLARPAPARWLEIGVLVVANLVATLARFLLLRLWVFRR